MQDEHSERFKNNEQNSNAKFRRKATRQPVSVVNKLRRSKQEKNCNTHPPPQGLRVISNWLSFNPFARLFFHEVHFVFGCLKMCRILRVENMCFWPCHVNVPFHGSSLLQTLHFQDYNHAWTQKRWVNALGGFGCLISGIFISHVFQFVCLQNVQYNLGWTTSKTMSFPLLFYNRSVCDAYLEIFALTDSSYIGICGHLHPKV